MDDQGERVVAKGVGDTDNTGNEVHTVVGFDFFWLVASAVAPLIGNGNLKASGD